MRTGLCPKCRQITELNKHHVFPVVHFGHNRKIFYLCVNCHRDLEHHILISEGTRRGRRKKKEREHYVDVLCNFLKGQYDEQVGVAGRNQATGIPRSDIGTRSGSLVSS